jgi:hypothetical protein
MKILVTILSCLSMSSFAFGSQELLKCETASVMTDYDETTGTPKFEDFVMSLTVTEDKQTQYGFRADYIHETKKVAELDTNYSVLPFDSQDEDMVAMVNLLRPDIDINDIETVGYANIGVDANAGDQAGIALWNLFSKKGDLLGIVGLFGWAPGRCN